MFWRRRLGRHGADPDRAAPRRLCDGDTVLNPGQREPWAILVTRELPVVTEAPLLTRGAEHRTHRWPW